MKICLDCGETFEGTGPRCPLHQREHSRTIGSASQRGYDVHWRRIQKEAIRKHLLKYGLICPGWGVPVHTVTKDQLTGDHIIPLSSGGESTAENCQVLCGACNRSKGAQVPADLAVVSRKVADELPPPVKKRFLIYKYNLEK